jgi:hypothetical protein
MAQTGENRRKEAAKSARFWASNPRGAFAGADKKSPKR